MTPFLGMLIGLYVLAIVECACSGYRAAAGRSAMIDKRLWYRHALVRGALWGHVPVLVAGLTGLALWEVSWQPEMLLHEYEDMARGVLTVYLPFAVVILVAMAVHLIPSVDLRSVISTLVFAPCTLIRPVVLVAGVLYFMADPSLFAVLHCGIIVVMMLTFEDALGRQYEGP